LTSLLARFQHWNSKTRSLLHRDVATVRGTGVAQLPSCSKKSSCAVNYCLPGITCVSILRPNVCGTERGVRPGHAKARTVLSGFCQQRIAVPLLLPSDGVQHIAEIYICFHGKWSAVLSLQW